MEIHEKKEILNFFEYMQVNKKNLHSFSLECWDEHFQLLISNIIHA